MAPAMLQMNVTDRSDDFSMLQSRERSNIENLILI